MIRNILYFEKNQNRKSNGDIENYFFPCPGTLWGERGRERGGGGDRKRGRERERERERVSERERKK